MEGKAGAVSNAAPGVREEIAKVGERTAGILTAAEDAAGKLRDEAKSSTPSSLRADAEDESRKARLNASQKMDEMIADAETKSQQIIDDAVARRRQLNQAISSLLDRRDEIAADAARLAEELIAAVEDLRSPTPRDAASPRRSRRGSRRRSSRHRRSPSRQRTRSQSPSPTRGRDRRARVRTEERRSSSPSPRKRRRPFEEDSEETKIYEPDTADLPQGPSTLLVDPDARTRRPRGYLGSHLARGAPARGDRAVDVAVPDRGRLRARPVDSSDGLAKGSGRSRSSRSARTRPSSSRATSARPPSCARRSRLGSAARDPKRRPKTRTTSARRSARRPEPQRRAARPSRKPRRTPGEPSGGVLSKIALTEPPSETPDPERPSARQKGSS